MTGRTCHALAAALFGAIILMGTGDRATAAEATGANGIVTVTFDESVWEIGQDDVNEPELVCIDESCGGGTAACGTVVLQGSGDGLNDETFRNGFRENLAEKALQSARDNVGADATPEIVELPSVATFGDNTGVTLSMRIAFDGASTRVDNFWLLAGADLAGLACIVADANYDQARAAFEKVYSGLAISPQ